MFVVYWSEVQGETLTPHARQFASTEMLAAMAWMEALRTRQRAGEAIGFVTMCSENPDSVGHPGVAAPGPGYNWTKRRRR